MGTGVVSVVLHELPYNAPAVRYISYVVFCLNILLFCIFSVITAARYALYPETWGAMIADPTQPLFLGCFPIGFASQCHTIHHACLCPPPVTQKD